MAIKRGSDRHPQTPSKTADALASELRDDRLVTFRWPSISPEGTLTVAQQLISMHVFTIRQYWGPVIGSSVF